jgi:nucleoside-diphosphate-sugar epimerase
MSETWFLTGALGCIGAWVTKVILERGDQPMVFDAGSDRKRLAAILDADHLDRVRFVQGDIGELDTVRSAMVESGAKHVVHLAGLQVPFCKTDPPLGARVNVLGTLHVFEAALTAGIERVVYASSAAVYGPARDGQVPDENSETDARTHYRVLKRATEGNARVYWLDRGLSSIGIRPLTVYGVGRDQGMTSGPTKAMKAAVVERDFCIPFGGATDFNYVADTAQAFVAAADRGPSGAHVFNLHGDSVEVARIIEVIEAVQPSARGRITWTGDALPIPPELDGRALRATIENLPCTSLEEGIRQTMTRFRALHAAGRLDTSDLG